MGDRDGLFPVSCTLYPVSCGLTALAGELVALVETCHRRAPRSRECPLLETIEESA